MKIQNKIVGIFVLYVNLCGFTFNEAVLTECEKQHPNDFIARLVCNSRVEKEFIEEAALPCVNQSEKELENKKELFSDFLIKNSGNSIESILTNLRSIGYDGKVIKHNNENQQIRNNEFSTIVFLERPKCNSEIYFLFNLNLDANEDISSMHVWRKEAKSKPSNEQRIISLSWRRSDHLKEIELAALENEIRRKRVAEEQRKIQANSKVQEEKIIKAYDKILRLIGLMALIITVVATAIFFKKNKYIKNKIVKLFENLGVTIFGRIKIKEDVKDSNKEIFDSNQISPPPISLDMGNQRDFRMKNNFVSIDVPIMHQELFLKECEWYKNKKGVYPGASEQKSILNELIGEG